jgi:DNA-binding LytR/AlgR family response regulator
MTIRTRSGAGGVRRSPQGGRAEVFDLVLDKGLVIDVHARCGIGRIAALTGDSVLLLEPNEIRYAEADRHVVWLTTDYGRLRAATKGMQHLERELAGHGFVRVHRSFLINPERVRRVHHKGHGIITLSTDHRRVESIPVSRRCTHEVRRLFGI